MNKSSELVNRENYVVVSNRVVSSLGAGLWNPTSRNILFTFLYNY